METLYLFVLAVAALAISPGPDNIFVLTQSIVYGKKYGLATVAGLMTGCIIHTTLVAFGVSTFILSVPYLFLVIKIFGAVYLLFLAFKVYKSNPEIQMDVDSVEQKTTGQLFKIGFTMNVLNPKVTIFFLAFFPGFLFDDSMSMILQFYVLGGLFILTSSIVFSSVAFLGGVISEKIKNNSQIGIWLKWLQIIVFVGIAIVILI